MKRSHVRYVLKTAFYYAHRREKPSNRLCCLHQKIWKSGMWTVLWEPVLQNSCGLGQHLCMHNNKKSIALSHSCRLSLEVKIFQPSNWTASTHLWERLSKAMRYSHQQASDNGLLWGWICAHYWLLGVTVNICFETWLRALPAQNKHSLVATYDTRKTILW